MSQITFERLINEVSGNGHDTECVERFQFICSVKNLTVKTMMCYAERIIYLHRFSVKLGKELSELTTRDIQQHILSILREVSPEAVNGRIRVYKVFYSCSSTVTLMERFYDGWLSGQSKSSALRSASISVLRERRESNGAAHPLFWGGFVLIGDPN